MSAGRGPGDDPLRRALRRCSRALWIVLGFGLVINLLFLVTPLYMMQVYDRVLASQRAETLLMLTLIAAFALLILGVLEAVRGSLLVRIGNWLESVTSADLIRASVGAALTGGNVNAQALRDLNTLRQFITGSLKPFLDLPWTAVFLGALWIVHPALGWFALAAAAVLLVLALLNQLLTSRAARAANAARVANEASAEQVVRNADVLAAMGMLPRFIDGWMARHAGVLALNRRSGDGAALLLGATRFARLLAQSGILGLGAWLAISGDMTAGTIVAGSILMGRALAPIEQSVAAWSAVVAARNARARLRALTVVFEDDDEPMALPPPVGQVAGEDLWYQPPNAAEPVLKGISFAVAPGEAMAIIGPSASGKSTLCKILAGAWHPTKGHVRLDAADLHTEWPSAQRGAHIGYVPQEIEFFAATVKENIARLAADPAPEAVVAAARAAGVHEMILALPRGYDTAIGPGGHVLSGGQKQRIALARALYGEPRLILLDEPDSNLDGAGEAALAEAIRAATQWPGTVVLVTHNPRLLRLVDKVMLLDHGTMRAYGSRDRVISKLLADRSGASIRGAAPRRAVSRGKPDAVAPRLAVDNAGNAAS